MGYAEDVNDLFSLSIVRNASTIIVAELDVCHSSFCSQEHGADQNAMDGCFIRGRSPRGRRRVVLILLVQTFNGIRACGSLVAMLARGMTCRPARRARLGAIHEIGQL